MIRDEIREGRTLVETVIKQHGRELYASYNDDERTLVAFGMQPHDKVLAAEKALLLHLTDNGEDEIGYGFSPDDVTRLLCVAVMDAANHGDKPLVV